MAQQIQLRNDSTAAWAEENPVLAQAEIGVDTTLGKFKIGNGTSTWTQLQFQSASIADFEFIDDGGDGSFMTITDHDMTIRTLRDEDSVDSDCDINIEAADDVFIRAYGDEVGISAKDEVTITSNSNDTNSDKEWTFNRNGHIKFPDGTVQITSAQGIVPLPDFLTWREGRTHLPDLNTHFGWNSQGLWFQNAQGSSPITSYPIYTDFTIPQNSSVVVEFIFDANTECNNIGVCVYSDGGNPAWDYATNSSRIAAQFDCFDLKLFGRNTSEIGNVGIPESGLYRVRFAYDPTASTDKVTVSYKLQGSDEIIESLSINEALPAGPYRIGFAADQDSSSTRTYMTYVSINVNDGDDIYGADLDNGNSGITSDVDLVVPTAIKDGDGDDFITFTRTSTGTARIATPQDDLSLRSARDITLFPGSDGDGNVYIGWGDAELTPDATNRVATIADVTAATGLGDITFDGVQIIGGGTASSDGLGNGTIRLVPDADEAEDDQFLVIEPTQPGIQGAPGHIHLRAGGTIDESNADLILGGERNSVVVSDTEKEIKVSTAFRSKLYFTNLNSNSDTEFIVSETANILVGDTVYVGGNGESYIVDAVTFDGGLATVTADGASFGAGAQYLFTREESYNNGWAFGSDGVFSGPYMGSVAVPGLAGTQTDDLYIYSPNNDIIINATSGKIILDGGASGTDVYINSDSLENKVATLGDFPYIRVEVPTTSLGQAGDIAHYVADDTSHHYFCTGTYDGTTHIWKRIAWSNDTWPGV
jgi:hypothetical protein